MAMSVSLWDSDYSWCLVKSSESVDLVFYDQFRSKDSSKVMGLGVWSQRKFSVLWWEAGFMVIVGSTDGVSCRDSEACGIIYPKSIRSVFLIDMSKH